MFHPSFQKIFEEDLQSNDFILSGDDYAMMIDCLTTPSEEPESAVSTTSTLQEEDQQEDFQPPLLLKDAMTSLICPNPINMKSFRIVECIEPFQTRCSFSAQEREDYIFMLKTVGEECENDDSEDGVASVTSTCVSSITGSRDSEDNITVVQCDQWKARFKELVEYREEFGNCHIPYDWKPNKRLSQWVKRQRHQRRLQKEGKHSNLTEERERMLEDLGFIWDSRAANWEERLNELVHFKAQNGHCKVTTKYTAYRPLAVWLKRQRHAVREFIKGAPDTGMTEERVARLFEIGVNMNIHRSMS
jgi:hypothetical protein